MQFFHLLEEKIKKEIYKSVPKGFIMVKVILEDYKSNEYIGIGFSKCHAKDNYNEEKGIEIALGRALKNLSSNLPDSCIIGNVNERI